MIHPSPPPRRYGFRCSIWDAQILAAGLGMTLWLHSIHFPLWWIVAMAVGHFFLFCNVFLVWRNLELLWAVLFVINVAVHAALNEFRWWPASVWQFPVTLAVIWCQMRSPWYHGVFARRLNPHLEKYVTGTLPPKRDHVS